MSYLQQLDEALRDCGFARRRRRRIVSEFADHLEQNPSAELGDPTQIAHRFADALGTHRARTAALAAFAALVVTGAIVAIRAAAMFPLRADGSRFDTTALLVAILAGQVALAAGGLALLRALRLRRAATVSRREAILLGRRAGVGLVAGAITILAFPFQQTHEIGGAAAQIGGGSTNGIWTALSAAGLLALASATPAVIRAARVRPRAIGPAGDLLTDLRLPASPARTPTRVALLFAGALALVVTVAGIAADDPYDGMLRGVLEGAACLAGYGLLGGYLGLRGVD